MHEILAILQLFGNVPVSSELLTIQDKLWEVPLADILRTLAGILSLPVALLGFKLINCSYISSSVVGWNLKVVREDKSCDPSGSENCDEGEILLEMSYMDDKFWVVSSLVAMDVKYEFKELLIPLGSIISTSMMCLW